jgi:hypothetical protein
MRYLMNCPNAGPPILRWPYRQDIARPGQTLGHCPLCMQSFPVGQDVPEHKSEGPDVASPGPHLQPEGADDHIMRIFCLIGLHDWHLEDWSGRFCPRCDHREILIYTAAGGAVWERVT